MQVAEFQNKYGVSKRTVNKWLKKGYIPGAVHHVENNCWEIPDSARCPYTEQRAKSRETINLSIIKAATKGKQVMPALYGISDDEFQLYINNLINANYIYSFEEDNVIYYNATIQGEELIRQNRKKALKLIEMIFNYSMLISPMLVG